MIDHLSVPVFVIRLKFWGFNLTYTTLWDIKKTRKEAGHRKAPGGVPAFPYFLVLLI